MSGMHGGVGRILAMGIALALALLLLVVSEAKAGKYAVAQCGWYVGADADWADTTGGAKFRSDAYCVPPPGSDPFDGMHMKSFTRDNQTTVSGTRFARWRWSAPAGTGITQIRGTWWHALHDEMEQRIGSVNWGGGFDVFASASTTDVALREFVAGFPAPVAAIEDRLLCAKAESKWCNLSPGSWAGTRAVTITLQDDYGPAAGIGGEIMGGGWRRGAQGIGFWGSDTGAGIRYGETNLDGGRVGLAEYGCAKALIGSEWRGTQMRPCNLSVSGGQTLSTTSFSDGPHSINHCVTDFAGNVGCTPQYTVLIDNNPPAHPRGLALAGGEAWRRTDDFDLYWANPDQGPASPIGGALWRIVGPAGYDTGVRFAPGRDLTALPDLAVPLPGIYSAQLWLRDEAGNEAPSSAVSVPLRLDNVAPGVAFAAGGPDVPETLRADVTDAHSGPAGGEIFYRRLDNPQWTDLPTKLVAGASADTAQLLARLPELSPGTYVFRAQAVDVAGNVAATTRRADGTEMAVRKVPPPIAVKAAEPVRAKTRIFARLGWRRRLGTDITVPFGSGAFVAGRLVNADGAGLAERELRVVSRPSHGAVSGVQVEAVGTGPHGGFRVDLPAGPSRRVTINYQGDVGLEQASRPSLALRVRGGLSLSARPKALRTGQVVRLRGKVRGLGAPMPRRGKLVAIQYFETKTRRWRPVLVTRSDHNGAFRARYRFRYVTGVARIRLRATALSEDGWPYAPGSSRPVAVSVRG